MPYTYQIDHQPSYAGLNIELDSGQSIIVASAAMAAMDASLTLESSVRGGLLKGIKRMATGGSLFMSEFTASANGGNIYITPVVPGDILHYYLDGTTGLILEASEFLACSPQVEMETNLGRIQSFYANQSLFLAHFFGEGDIWFNSYGAVIEVPVDGEYIIDTGYITAFEDSLDYRIEIVSEFAFHDVIRHSLLNRQANIINQNTLVCRFQGEGRVWLQARKLDQLMTFLECYRKVKSK